MKWAIVLDGWMCRGSEMRDGEEMCGTMSLLLVFGQVPQSNDPTCVEGVGRWVWVLAFGV